MNIPENSNLVPSRPSAAPVAPMGRHNRSVGQIFNVVAFGVNVGTMCAQFSPSSPCIANRGPEKRGRLPARCRSLLVARMNLNPWHPKKYTPE